MTTALTPRFERVMVIDDSELERYIASRVIKSNNFSQTILDYPSAEEALVFLTENQDNISLLPRIIFVDIHMPGMTGFEFMEIFDRLSSSLKNYSKVYIVSSSIDQTDISKAEADPNIVAFREKPMTKEFLARIII